MSTSGVTGRGRGAPGRMEPPPPTVGRGRGRGILDDFDNQVPGLSSLRINGNGDINGYQEDAWTALETVTSKSNNTTEVVSVLTKWLDLACTNEDIGEAVATCVCELMAHAEYGEKIRTTVLGRIFELFQGCTKEKSPTVLALQLSFMGYMYLIQRDPSQKRFDLYVDPICLFMKEILKHKLTADIIKLVTKQVAINAVALTSTPKGQSELDQILVSVRQALLSQTSDSKVRPYLLFLCDLQGSAYQPLPEVLLKFYSQHIPNSLLESCKPLDIDVKLYKVK